MNTAFTTDTNTNTSTSNGSKITRTLITATAAAAIAIGLSACGAATEQSAAADAPIAEPTVVTETETNTAEADVIETVVDTDTSATEADDVSGHDDTFEQARHSGQTIPASTPDVPCTTYTEATEYPLHPCSKGPLVTQAQQLISLVDPTIEADGYFGSATYDTVVSWQHSFQLIDTGVIDATFISELETYLGHGDDDIDDEQYDDVVHGITEFEHCVELQADGFPVATAQVEVCEDFGIILADEQFDHGVRGATEFELCVELSNGERPVAQAQADVCADFNIVLPAE